MNNPAITWRLRKIGRTWWSSLRVRSQPRWLAPREPVAARAATKPQGLRLARAESTDDMPRDRNCRGAALSTASRSWLAASLV